MVTIYALFICSMVKTYDGTAWIETPHCEQASEPFATAEECRQRLVFFVASGTAKPAGGHWACMEAQIPAWQPGQ
jgi:hypothetical protein